MKKLLVFLCILLTLSCKKQIDTNSSDLTRVNWVLETATVNHQIMVNGVPSNDYKNALGPQSCLASDYTLSFLSNGYYQFSSSGALCDMVGQTDAQTWSRDGEKVILNNKNSQIIATVSDNTLTYTIGSELGVVYWQYIYTYKAKTK